MTCCHYLWQSVRQRHLSFFESLLGHASTVFRSTAGTLQVMEQLLCSGCESKLLSSVLFLPTHCLQLGFVETGILFGIYKQDIKFCLGWLYYLGFMKFSKLWEPTGASELHVTITCTLFKLIFSRTATVFRTSVYCINILSLKSIHLNL